MNKKCVISFLAEKVRYEILSIDILMDMINPFSHDNSSFTRTCSVTSHAISCSPVVSPTHSDSGYVRIQNIEAISLYIICEFIFCSSLEAVKRSLEDKYKYAISMFI